MPEIVVDGENGFIVAPGDRPALADRLRWLVAHPEDAARMGAAGRRRVLERFQWKSVVQRCLDAYAAV
jgi:glycosyltransferase involved in cell wall biosynthesis